MSLRTISERLANLYEIDGSNRRYLPLEGMRGLAILLVFFCHFDIIVGQPLALSGIAAIVSKVIGEIGGAGVDLFFVLSGFLIYRSAIRPDLEFGSFLKRRAERIFPTFLAVFALYLALALIGVGDRRMPPGALPAAIYVMANLLFLPGVFDIQPLISAAWSLSYEWYFYLTLPLFLILLRASRWRSGARLGAIFCLGIAHVLVCVLAPHWLPIYKTQDGTFVRVILFLGGMALCEFRSEQGRRNKIQRINESLLLAIGAIAIGAFCAQEAIRLAFSSTHTHDLPAWFQALRAVLLVVGWVALVEAGLRPQTLTSRALTSRPLRWLGNISYSFYLIHPLPMHITSLMLSRIVRITGHPALLYAVSMLPIFLTIAAVATVLFVVVERPLSLEGKLRRHLHQPHRKEPDTTRIEEHSHA
jgi:exopolysaccharide production protein ExoZ